MHPKSKKYIKLIVLIPLLFAVIGLVVVFASGSPNTLVLIPLFSIAGGVVGVFSCAAIWIMDRERKFSDIQYPTIIVALLAGLYFLPSIEENCTNTEAQARVTLKKYLTKNGLNASYVSGKGHKEPGCEYLFTYDGGGHYRGYFVTEDGRVYR